MEKAFAARHFHLKNGTFLFEISSDDPGQKIDDGYKRHFVAGTRLILAFVIEETDLTVSYD